MNEPVNPRPTVTFREKQYYVDVSKYDNNDNTALLLVDEDATIQVKCSANFEPLPADHFYIKDYSENRGVVKALTQAKLIEEAGPYKRNGQVEIKMYRATPKLADAFGIALSAGPSTPDPIPVEPAQAPEEPPEYEDEAIPLSEAFGEGEPAPDTDEELDDEMPADATAGVPDPEGDLPPSAA